MRLLQVDDVRLVEFAPDQIPRYAILSHTWEEEEVLFSDMLSGAASCAHKAGWKKIVGTCQQAKSDGIPYAWIDTCCIDKSSSAELSEAINSMFNWYKDAVICYVYLADVDMRGLKIDVSPFEDSKYWTWVKESRWWTRGWTLQELIAPWNVIFFDGTWHIFGNRKTFAKSIERSFGIDEAVLQGLKPVDDVSIARRMYWASSRETARVEDLAYCLLGLFDISMPLIYGEGAKAFIRLQEEIIRKSDDESIFAWNKMPLQWLPQPGILAPSPEHFYGSAEIVPIRGGQDAMTSFSMTNKGLYIELYVCDGGDKLTPSIALLNCSHSSQTLDQVKMILLPLVVLSREHTEYGRTFLSGGLASSTGQYRRKRIYVAQKWRKHSGSFEEIFKVKIETKSLKHYRIEGSFYFSGDNEGGSISAATDWIQETSRVFRMAPQRQSLTIALLLQPDEETKGSSERLLILIGGDFRVRPNAHVTARRLEASDWETFCEQRTRGDWNAPTAGQKDSLKSDVKRTFERIRGDWNDMTTEQKNLLGSYLKCMFEKDAKNNPRTEVVRVPIARYGCHCVSLHRNAPYDGVLKRYSSIAPVFTHSLDVRLETSINDQATPHKS